MKRFSVALAATCVAALSFGGPRATAQNAAPQLDVVGLKLGMTVQQAEDALKQHEPNIKIMTLYATEDPASISTWGGYGRATIEDDSSLKFPVRDSRIKAIVGLRAGVLTHALDVKGNEISNSDTPIYSVQGEWFHLNFTPSDEGGRLYAIGRAVEYGLAPNGIPAGPTVDALNQEIIEKYGAPSYHAGPLGSPTNFERWGYDIRGRLLSSNSADFRRCLPPIEFPALNFHINGTTMGGRGYEGLTLKDYNDAFRDVDGFTLDNSRRRKLTTMSEIIQNGLAPSFTGGNTAYRERFRKCGALLETSFGFSGPPSDRRVDLFITRLSDQNAVYFDNGIETYLRAKLSRVNGPAPATAKTKL